MLLKLYLFIEDCLDIKSIVQRDNYMTFFVKCNNFRSNMIL